MSGPHDDPCEVPPALPLVWLLALALLLATVTVVAWRVVT